jgi:hypothetical protein
MPHPRRLLLALTAIAVASLAMPVGTTLAQVPASTIHGTLLAVRANAFEVRTLDGATVTVGVGAATAVVEVIAASLADVKPGSYVGTAAMPGTDGTLIALEVHIFPEQMRGAGEGHRPFTMGPRSTMTNGTVGGAVGGAVATVGSVSGRTITVQYAGGAKTVLVPANVPVVRFEPGSKTMLQPGAHVSVTATEPAGGGMPIAMRIAVGRDGRCQPV